ncbi:MAG TPA: hypothetical protein VKL19_02125 [Thermoanaerobaculia bacterium]|nr:hypothetical protein [Thermoanaerobaculia bacterium]
MSEELMLVEAALFQLKSAAASVDPMNAAQMQLTISVLSNAIEAAEHGMSAAAVNDIEFALNDVAGMLGELNATDAERIAPIVTVLQDDVARLKESTSLPSTVINGIRVFQTKLKARRAAVERSTYRPEGAPEEPLPHPPEDLQREAVPLRQQLAAAGFATPALDGLIAEPASLRFHSINEILNELDVIVG